MNNRIIYYTSVFLYFLFYTRTEFTGIGLGVNAGLSYILRALSLFGLIGLFFLIESNKIKKDKLYIVVFFGFYLAISNISGVTYFSFIVIACVVSGILFAASASGSGKLWHLQLNEIYLKVNVAGLVLAFVSYNFMGAEIDYHHLMFPWSIARAQEFLGHYRITGFQIEPGTYTASIYSLVVVNSFFKRSIGGFLQISSMLSTLFTFSAWAALANAFYFSALMLYFFSSRLSVKKFIFLNSLIVCSLIVFGSVYDMVLSSEYYSYISDRFDSNDATGSMSAKIIAWRAWKENFNVSMAFPHSVTDPYCLNCASPQDLGTIVNMFYYIGGLVTTLIVFAVFWGCIKKFGFSFFVLFVPLVFAKFFFFDPVVWYMMFLFIFELYSRPKKRGQGRNWSVVNYD